MADTFGRHRPGDGIAIRYPGQSIEHDYSYAPNHPIADTYRTYCAEQTAKGEWTELIKTCPHDHATSDLSSVLYAARPDRDYYSLSKPGRITVLENGGARLDPLEEGTHRYLIVNEQQRVRALEAMMLLASQPPVRSQPVSSGSKL